MLKNNTIEDMKKISNPIGLLIFEMEKKAPQRQG